MSLIYCSYSLADKKKQHLMKPHKASTEEMVHCTGPLVLLYRAGRFHCTGLGGSIVLGCWFHCTELSSIVLGKPLPLYWAGHFHVLGPPAF